MLLQSDWPDFARNPAKRIPPGLHAPVPGVSLLRTWPRYTLAERLCRLRHQLAGVERASENLLHYRLLPAGDRRASLNLPLIEGIETKVFLLSSKHKSHRKSLGKDCILAGEILRINIWWVA
jgi:hypothetical protein